MMLLCMSMRWGRGSETWSIKIAAFDAAMISCDICKLYVLVRPRDVLLYLFLVRSGLSPNVIVLRELLFLLES